MALRRSDSQSLRNLINEYGLVNILNETLDIFDEDVAETEADDQAIGVLERALRKVSKLQAQNRPKPGRAPALGRGVGPGGDEEEFDEDEDEEFDEEDEDEELGDEEDED